MFGCCVCVCCCFVVCECGFLRVCGFDLPVLYNGFGCLWGVLLMLMFVWFFGLLFWSCWFCLCLRVVGFVLLLVNCGFSF